MCGLIIKIHYNMDTIRYNSTHLSEKNATISSLLFMHLNHLITISYNKSLSLNNSYLHLLQSMIYLLTSNLYLKWLSIPSHPVTKARIKSINAVPGSWPKTADPGHQGEEQ